MKKGRRKEEEKQTSLSRYTIASETLEFLKWARVYNERAGVDPETQVVDFLTKASDQDRTSTDLRETTLSIGYKFGDWLLEQYPAFSARMDNRSSMRVKQRELKRIGASDRTVRMFGEIGDPNWGETFRGVGLEAETFKFHLKRQTYRPFRQELKISIDTEGDLNWQYAYTLYTPESLYFWTPNDTMGVNTPEFKHGYWNWEPVKISGSVSSRGKLVFEDLHFGNMVVRTGVPSFEIAEMTASKILLRQTHGVMNGDGRKYLISNVTVRDLFDYIQTDDAFLNTNPLLPFKTLGEAQFNVHLGRKV